MRVPLLSNCLSRYHHGTTKYPLVDNIRKRTSALVWHHKHSYYILKHFWKSGKSFSLFCKAYTTLHKNRKQMICPTIWKLKQNKRANVKLQRFCFAIIKQRLPISNKKSWSRVLNKPKSFASTMHVTHIHY